MSDIVAPTIYRASLGLKDAIAPAIAADYHSPLVEELRANGYRLTRDGITVILAREFGFCYGVDKAVDMAYETRLKFPDRRIFLTYEIIHNPRVNERLAQLGIQFLSGSRKGSLTFADITAADVVIMPAFGVSTDYLEKLKSIGCVLVDTTCGSVVHVWKRVEKYARDGYTSLVHGKALHAETIATVSQAQRLGGRWLVVRDKKEADMVCAVIRGTTDPVEVLKLGSHAMSPGFDPHRDLERVGVANQTTMLASESLEIGAMVGRALAERHAEEAPAQHFRSFDTICSATQERQDAIIDLVKDGGVDLLLIVGGYNSSNTGHLLEIVGKSAPAFHIGDSTELISATEIRHKPAGSKETIVSPNWLPKSPFTVGITAGASTPNRAIGDAIERVFELSGVQWSSQAVPAK